MVVAAHVNTFHGRLDLYGPFDDEASAWEWHESEEGQRLRTSAVPDVFDVKPIGKSESSS